MHATPAHEVKPIACILSALTDEEDARRRDLARELARQVVGASDLAEGRRYDLGPAVPAWLAAAELVTLERRCCPFLTFELSAVSGDSCFALAVTGPPGTREFLHKTLFLAG
jgi:hypothetical protein